MPNQSLTITRQQLQDCQNSPIGHGELEGALLRLFAKLKTENGGPLFVKVDFPPDDEDAGVRFECRKGWAAMWTWKLGRAVRLW